MRVNNRVHMLGYRTDINDILRNIDIYLLPSIREGLNVSLMEAMASGLPCICSDIRGNRDLIFDYKGGMRVHSTNVDEWYKAICEIQNLDCIKMGRYNLNIICNFSKNVVIEKMKKIYGSMHGKRIVNKEIRFWKSGRILGIFRYKIAGRLLNEAFVLSICRTNIHGYFRKLLYEWKFSSRGLGEIFKLL